MSDGDINVKVCIRVRPLGAREVIDCCRVCTNFVPGEPQIILGSDKAFTYDDVYSLDAGQRDIYKNSIECLVDSCFEGLNTTILAYGQTGSGKTYTMGTQFDECIRETQRGMIPRAVDHVFDRIRKLKQDGLEAGQMPPEFTVSAQFMELYNEEILDLLSPSGEAKGKKSNLKIHEDGGGEIYVEGMSSQAVANSEEVLSCLQQGALCRTTASTEMNAVSSRSHALFSLKICQTRSVPKAEDDESTAQEFENLSAKLVFVDLAGSERLKRTGATGDRAKEGISINGGLLALGNVISALGDEKRKTSHVPYRDSKLTRLLQNSLGGNSQTLMLACVSPADRDFMETLNTLKYANRAKNIKNKVVVNQDKTSRIINALREENMRLQQELMEYKMGQKTGEEGTSSDMFTENTMLRADNDKLRLRIKAMKEAQDSKDEQLAALRARTLCADFAASGETDMTEMVQGYIKEIEALRTQLLEQESAASMRTPRNRNVVTSRLSMVGTPSTMMNDSINEVIKEAKCDLEKTMAKRSKLEHLKDAEITKLDLNDDNKENLEDDDAESEEEMDCENNFINLEEDNIDNTLKDDIKDDIGDNIENENVPDDKDSDDGEFAEENIEAEKIQDMEENLADLADEISIKQKLVEELEKSQKKITAMKQQYEEKLHLLQNQIQVTCDERDKVMTSLKVTGDTNKNKDEIKTKSDHYTKKLKTMEQEMKRLKSAQREHDRLVRTNKDNEKHLKQMQNEVTQMKKNKVKLMRQLKEDTAKSKKTELKKQQEIIKLQRDKQKQVTTIKKMQMEQKTKDMVLKRKQQEIKMMKKQKNAIVAKKSAARRGGGINQQQIIEAEQPEERHNRRLSSQYSSFSARNKWNQIEKRICQNVIRKHTVAQMEAGMDRLVKDREKLEKSLDQSIKAKDTLLKENQPNSDELQVLDEEIEGFSAQVEYLQESINEHQSDIVELMESREGGDTIDLQEMINSSSLSDCKYLLEHFLAFSTNKGLAAAQSNTKVKEIEAAVKSMKQALEETEQKLLDQFNKEKKLEEQLELAKENDMLEEGLNETLFQTPSKTHSMLISKASSGRKFFPPAKDSMGMSLLQHLQYVVLCLVFWLCQLEVAQSNEEEASPPVLETRLSSVLEEDAKGRRLTGLSPRGSPTFERRDSGRKRKEGSAATSENVFERLHSQADEPPPEGHIVPVTSPERPDQIYCVCMAKGHTASVQSVSVSSNIMVTGSSDKTIRVWDLTENKETQRACFPDPVKKVVYSREESVVYAITSQSLKAWDIRTDPSTCRSAALAESPSALLYPDQSKFIYFSMGVSVRSWNVAEWSAAGVLHGHSGHVMCLEHVELDDKKYIITGSRDHFCKVYDATDGIASARVPTATLNPPHFDGIEALLWKNDHLYSGCRDATIKKWHLKTRKEKGSHRGAHKDRVRAFAYVPNLSALASASRDGTLKLWNEHAFSFSKPELGKSLLVEINAHPASPIQDLTFQNNQLYTASGDTTVKVWAVK